MSGLSGSSISASIDPGKMASVTTQFARTPVTGRSPHATAVKDALIRLPDLSDSFELLDIGELHYDCFSDGSTHRHSDYGLELSAWALVSATHGQCISAGALDGLQQTINRAELMAAWSAVQWMFLTQKRVTLWCDSAYVAAGFNRLRANPYDVTEKNEDLWAKIACILQQVPHGQFQVVHIAGHMQPEQETDPVREWCAVWNSTADRAANMAQLYRPTWFNIVWHQRLAALSEQCRDLRQLRAFHLELASKSHQLWKDRREAMVENDEAEEEVLRPRVPTGSEPWVEHLPLNWACTWRQSTDVLQFGRLSPIQLLDWLLQASAASIAVLLVRTSSCFLSKSS